MDTLQETIPETQSLEAPVPPNELDEACPEETISEAMENEFSLISSNLYAILECVKDGYYLTGADRASLVDVYLASQKVLTAFSTAREELQRVRYYFIPQTELSRLTGGK